MPLPGQTIGEIVSVSPDPAAGGEILFTADQDMIVHGFNVTLVSNATVANRFVTFYADDGPATARIFFRTQCAFSQSANSTVSYSCFEGSPSMSGAYFLVPFPTSGLRLRKGDRLVTTTIALQAGDDYQPLYMSVEHF